MPLQRLPLLLFMVLDSLTGILMLLYARHPHVAVLFLVLDLRPLILLLLQLLGNHQVFLHQAVLMDIGSQVTLNCRHKHIRNALILVLFF